MTSRTQIALDEEFQRHPEPVVTWRDRARIAKQRIRNTNCKRFLLARFPLFGVIYSYKFREYILSDVLAGVSVGMSSVPQAMGYASILYIPVQYGLYTLIFSSLVYSLLTTSIHSSTIISAGGIIFTYDALESLGLNDELPTTNSTSGDGALSPEMIERLEAIFALSFISGITLIVTTLCKLSVLVKFNSEPHMAAVFAGTTTVIWLNQLAPMLGVTPDTHSGFLQTPMLFIDICGRVPDANLPTVILSVVVLSIILFFKDFVNPRLERILPAPIPVDIVVMILAALFSSLWDWQEEYEIENTGYIPSGLPKPRIPFRSNWTDYIQGGITIGILQHLGAPVLIQHFAVKHDYEVDMDQETFALGATTAITAITSCSGVGPSSPRLLMMESCGGRSQIAYIFAALTSLVVVLFLTDYGETLPKCVVACIILGSSLRAISNYGRIRKYWRRDKAFFLMWVFTYTCSLLFNVSDAILYGLMFSIFLAALKSKQMHITELYGATAKGIKYLIPSNKYKNCSPPATRAKIIAVNNPVFFANSGSLKKHVISIAAEAATKHLEGTTAAQNGTNGISFINQGFTHTENTSLNSYSNGIVPTPVLPQALQLIVLDFTGVPFIDTSTLRELLSLRAILQDRYNVALRISGCNEHCRTSLARAPKVYNKLGAMLYYTPQDAIIDISTDHTPSERERQNHEKSAQQEIESDSDGELTIM